MSNVVNFKPRNQHAEIEAEIRNILYGTDADMKKVEFSRNPQNKYNRATFDLRYNKQVVFEHKTIEAIEDILLGFNTAKAFVAEGYELNTERLFMPEPTEETEARRKAEEERAAAEEARRQEEERRKAEAARKAQPQSRIAAKRGSGRATAPTINSRGRGIMNPFIEKMLKSK